MTSRSKSIIIVSVLLISMLLLGCDFFDGFSESGGDRDVQKLKDDTKQWIDDLGAKEEARVAGEVSEEWNAATGEEIDTDTMHYTTGELSESHAIMAAMILQGQGMDPNLDSYGEVGIMEFTDADGVERAAVVIDGKVVLPNNQ